MADKLEKIVKELAVNEVESDSEIVATKIPDKNKKIIRMHLNLISMMCVEFENHIPEQRAETSEIGTIRKMISRLSDTYLVD